MSNFTGVTFAQQKVLPSDDAIIRRNILSDGVLYGCQLSYSGSTLTMGAGQLLICGRQIRHPSAQNWAVADATSGFARLVLTVDLTRTSSKEVFEQVVDSIEYATSQDGFPALNQSDVNTTGSVYQVAACVISLGTGGITGIVEQLGPCEVSGGGGLNFKLVGGLTQPADPAENTIWVETDFEITGYAFSATEPADPMEGLVWITVGTSSTVAFSATKKNPVMVYPISAKQYIDGAWVEKTAKSWQNGKWNDWVVYLYTKGDICEFITGGWAVSSNGVNSSYPNTGKAPTVTYNADSVRISQTRISGGMSYGGLWHTKNKVSLAGKTKLTAELDILNYDTGNGIAQLQIRTGVSGYMTGDSEIVAATIIADANGSKVNDNPAIDLSGLNLDSSAEYYVCIAAYSTFTADVFEIKST